MKIQFLNVLATFQVLHRHMWPVASVLDSASWPYLIGAAAAF